MITPYFKNKSPHSNLTSRGGFESWSFSPDSENEKTLSMVTSFSRPKVVTRIFWEESSNCLALGFLDGIVSVLEFDPVKNDLYDILFTEKVHQK